MTIVQYPFNYEAKLLFFHSLYYMYLKLDFSYSVGVILCTEINFSSENTQARPCIKKQEKNKKTCI